MNPRQIEDFFHLSPQQKQLIQSCEQSLSPDHFVSQFCCTISGELDVSAFKRAWNKLSDRHPALRLTFVSADLKEPVQVINRNVSTIFEEHDWRQFSPNEQNRKFSELKTADVQIAYQLKTAPLWWLTLVRLDEHRYHFLWSFHHSLFDQNSIAILWKELLVCYDAIRKGKSPELSAHPIFKNYIEWLKTQDENQAKKFWRNQFRGIQSATKAMPIDQETVLSLPVGLTRKVIEAHPEIDAQTILIGAWSLLYGRVSQSAKVVFGLASNARPKELSGAEGMIGNFDHLVPMVVNTDLKVTIQDWLQQLQKDITEASVHQFFTNDQIREWSEIAPDKALFNCIVHFTEKSALDKISYDHLNLKIRALSLTTPSSETPSLEFQLVENPHDSDHPLTFSLESLLESFATSPKKIITELLAPSHPVSAPIVAPAVEIDSDVEVGWVRWIKASVSFNQRLKDQVKTTPETVAVGDGKNSLTFRELDFQIEKLAAHLTQLGITATIPVGVCCSSPLMNAVAILGILRTGGSYVPLAQPPAVSTLQKILRQNSLPVILTEANLENKLSAAIAAVYKVPGAARPIPSVIRLEIDKHSAALSVSTQYPEVSDDHPAALIYNDLSGGDLSVERLSQYKLAKSLRDPLQWFLPVINPEWKLLTGDQFPDTEPEIEKSLPEVKIQTPPSQPVSEILAIPPKLEIYLPEPDISDLSDLIDEYLPLEAEPAPVEAVEFDLENLFDSIEEPTPEPEESFTDFAIIDEPEPVQTALVVAPIMLPTHHWFLEQNYENPHYGNHSWLVEIPDTLQPELLRQAIVRLIDEQEILRMKFIKNDLSWCTKFVQRLPELPLEIVDISSKWASSQRKALEDSAARIQASLHLSYSSLFNVAYFERGVERADRLLIVLHRMIGDDESRQIFLDRLMAHYEAIANNSPLSNDEKPISMKRQLDRLKSILTPEFIAAELQYWKKIRETSFPKFGTRTEEIIENYADVDKVFINLNPAETQYLLDSVSATEMNEMILAALTLAISKWSGHEQVFIEVETSIRQNPLLRLDLANTISPATTRYPVKFEVENSADPIQQMRSLRQQFRVVPHAGFGFELLKHYADAQTRMLLKKIPRPLIAYQFIELSKQASKWKTAPESIGSEFDPNNHFAPGIVVSGSVNRGMLDFQVSYSRSRYQQVHIGELANYFIDELRAAIATANFSTYANL